MFWKDVGLGFNTYGKALTLIFSKGLWWFFLFPLAFNILLFWGGIEGIGFLGDWFNAKLMGWLHLDQAEFWGSGVLKTILEYLVKGIFNFIFFALFAYLGGFIVLIIMSPVLAYVSEKTEKILTGNDYPFSSAQLMRDMVRGILLALRNMFIELGWSVLFFLIIVVPVIGWLIRLLQIDDVLLFLIASYFYGFSFLDYSIERQKLNVKKSVLLVRKRKGLALANGTIFSVTLFIPYIGVGLAGFTAIVSTVAAAIAMTQVVEEEKGNTRIFNAVPLAENKDENLAGKITD
ncbi:MAG: EI24 domain-containing protein [Bacteroidota bacterium]